MAYDWWLAPAVYAGISVALLEARIHRATSRGKELFFRGSNSLKLLYGGVSLALTVYLYRRWAETEWWVNLSLVALVICVMFGWPKTIVTNDRGIECLWWWRRKILIPWGEVEYAETNKAGAIEIVGNHARITFEGYNADPDRFCKEVTTRSTVKKIVTPGELTGLNL
jgi:hypothetical protein